MIAFTVPLISPPNDHPYDALAIASTSRNAERQIVPSSVMTLGATSGRPGIVIGSRLRRVLERLLVQHLS